MLYRDRVQWPGLTQAPHFPGIMTQAHSKLFIGGVAIL